MYNIIGKIQDEVKKVIIGKDEVVAKVLMAILAEGHVLLEDVPGVGKTTMAMAFAKTLGLETKRIQFTPDTMPSDITGFSVYNRDNSSLIFKPGPVMTNLLLADEINRTSAKTQSALLEAMEEKRVTADGQTYPLPEPFVVLATQNPAGSAGTQQLPAAQTDRFLMKLSIGYPDRESQVMIMKGRHSADPLDTCEAVTDISGLKEMISAVEKTHVEDSVYGYISDLAEATRNNEYILLGVSPRGALCVARTAKAHAFMDGRDYVCTDDVAAVFCDVCAHRLNLSAKARLHELTQRDLAQTVLDGVKRPDVKEFVIK